MLVNIVAVWPTVLALPLAPHAFEHGQPIFIAADRLPIDQAGP
jgi:hypothetical protein